MKVTLLHSTPLWVCARAIRTCWNSHDKSDTLKGSTLHFMIDNNLDWYQVPACGEKDKELIARVGNKNKHKSVLEHLVYSFEIDGISRACLQELARHRIASLSVKSTRYTLKELKDVDFEIDVDIDYQCWACNMDKLNKFIVTDYLNELELSSVIFLISSIQDKLKQGTSNDIVKYMLPECFKTSLVWTINARSLQNFLELRTSRSALPEIRKLALAVFEALPHKYLFEEFVNEKV